VFTSVSDLGRKLMRYIKAVQQDRQAVPVGLRRSDEADRMIPVQVVRTVYSQSVIVMRYVSGS